MRASIADCIVFTGSEELSRVAADYLRMKGVSNLLTPVSADECIDALTRFPRALLIADWQIGQAAVVQVLSCSYKRSLSAPRPVLIVAERVTESLVATAAEYGVAQIFTEAPTIKNLGNRLTGLILADSVADEVKKTLGEVADARAGGDLKGAVQKLQKILGSHPHNFRLRCETAEIMMQLGEWEKAHKILDGMERTKPPYLRGMHLLGRCLMKMGKLDAALTVLEQAKMLNPHDIDRLVDIGKTLLNADRAAEATQTFDEALAIDPKSRAARIGKGECKLMEGAVNEALALFKDVTSDLEKAALFNTCAILSMRHGRHDEGMNLYQAALRSLGKDPRLQSRLYFNMGLGYRRWAKKDKARECFTTACKLDAGFSKAKQQLSNLDAPPRALAGSTPDERARSALTAAGLIDVDGSFGDDTADMDDFVEGSLEETLFGGGTGKKPA